MRNELRIIRSMVVVAAPLISAQNRIEAFGIEVDEPDLRTPRRKGGQNRIADHRTETFRHRMAVDDEAFHQNASILAATLAMNFSRDSCVERFIE